MKKLFLSILVFLCCLPMARSQDGYGKIKTQIVINDSVKLLQGEIFSFKKIDSGHVSISFGPKEISLRSDKIEKIAEENVNTSLSSSASGFVKMDANGQVVLDITLIKPGDQVLLISEDGKQKLPLVKDRQASFDKNKYGRYFRLVIPGAPTFFYDVETLLAPPAPTDTTGKSNALPEPGEAKNTGTGIPASVFMIAAIVEAVAIGLIFLIPVIKKKIGKKKAGDKRVTYKKGSLEDFALENGITINDLISFNPEITLEYFNKKKKEEIENRVKKKKLIVKKAENSEDEDTSLPEYAGDKSKRANLANEDLLKLQDNIITEIRRLGAKNENKAQLDKIESEKKQIEEANEKLSEDLTLAKTQLEEANEKFLRKDGEVKKYASKMIHAEFLVDYCNVLSEYFKLCDEVCVKAYGFLNRATEANTQQASVIGALLIKFQENINSIQVGKWKQIIEDIKDSGATTNRQLIRSFAQPESNAEKQKEFCRLLFTEALVGYSSNILVLAESLRNLPRFEVPGHLGSEAEAAYTKYVGDLVNKMKAAGLEVKYVSLFRNYTEYLGKSKATNEKLKAPYTLVQKLEKDAIAQIVSFGFKNMFGESDTLTILA